LLLSQAADRSSDLIVMGGYGHSRLREFVLGGATPDPARKHDGARADGALVDTPEMNERRSAASLKVLRKDGRRACPGWVVPARLCVRWPAFHRHHDFSQLAAATIGDRDCACPARTCTLASDCCAR
jgi:hypothetical protein